MGGLWGSERSYGRLWGLIGVYGVWGVPMGVYGGLGGVGGPIGVWVVPMGVLGVLLRSGECWGSYGEVGGQAVLGSQAL